MYTLTPQQTRIAYLVAKGMSNKRIGCELNLKEGTIKQYMSRIFSRIGVSSRAELAVYWVRNELPQDGPADSLIAICSVS